MINKLKDTFRNTILHPRFVAQRELQKIVITEADNLWGCLLDVGCGKKPYENLFTNVTQYVGIDLTSTIHGQSRIDVFATSLALPFKDQSVDSVLCTEVLEHVPDPRRALQEIHRVTKPGGGLLLTVPLSEQLHEEPFDFYRFTKYGLYFLLEKTGWKVCRIYNRGGVWLEFGYRLSSFLYSFMGARRDPSGNLQPRFILAPLIVSVCAVVQGLAIVLDRICYSSLSTIGYGIYAKK